MENLHPTLRWQSQFNHNNSVESTVEEVMDVSI